MKFLNRVIKDEKDKYAISMLASRFADDNLHIVDLPYRLSSWALDDEQNAQLWFNTKNELVGWLILQTPFWMMDYVCHPEFEAELFTEMIKWADSRAKIITDTRFGHDCWFMHAFSKHKNRVQILINAGFSCQADVGENSWSKVLMQRPGSIPVKVYQPPAGFTIRPLNGQEEVEAYVSLHQTIFESKNMTEEWRSRTLMHNTYKPELDLVVADANGRLCAFCVCWFDEESKTGHIEPLGCHPDYRKYALGRVAFSHGLQRLSLMGATNIFVETDDYRNTAFRLYDFFGFEIKEEVLIFRKDY